MTRHNYKLRMKFHTDGDFGWAFVPVGMSSDDYENFELSGAFETVEEMHNWASTNLTFLVNNITGSKTIVEWVVEMLNNLREAMLNGEDHYEDIGGNYEGTYVEFIDEGDEIPLRFSVPEDLFMRMKDCDFNHDDFIAAMRHMVDEKEGNV